MADQTFEVYTSSATGTQIDAAVAKVAAMEETLSGTAGTIPSSAAVKSYVDKESTLSGNAVYDISEANNGTTYANLAAALNNGNNIPASIRKGGISIKFVQTSDNKYVQYRLMANTWSTNITDWQGVDEEPIAGSKSLVKSGGVYNKYKEHDDKLILIGGKNNIQEPIDCTVRDDIYDINGLVLQVKNRTKTSFELKGSGYAIFGAVYIKKDNTFIYTPTAINISFDYRFTSSSESSCLGLVATSGSYDKTKVLYTTTSSEGSVSLNIPYDEKYENIGFINKFGDIDLEGTEVEIFNITYSYNTNGKLNNTNDRVDDIDYMVVPKYQSLVSLDSCTSSYFDKSFNYDEQSLTITKSFSNWNYNIRWSLFDKGLINGHKYTLTFDLSSAQSHISFCFYTSSTYTSQSESDYQIFGGYFDCGQNNQITFTYNEETMKYLVISPIGFGSNFSSCVISNFKILPYLVAYRLNDIDNNVKYLSEQRVIINTWVYKIPAANWVSSTINNDNLIISANAPGYNINTWGALYPLPEEEGDYELTLNLVSNYEGFKFWLYTVPDVAISSRTKVNDEIWKTGSHTVIIHADSNTRFIFISLYKEDGAYNNDTIEYNLQLKSNSINSRIQNLSILNNKNRNDIDRLQLINTNYLANANVIVLGDSISAVSYNWVIWFQQLSHCKRLYNSSISGGHLHYEDDTETSQNQEPPRMIQRCIDNTATWESVDIAIIALGTNDRTTEWGDRSQMFLPLDDPLIQGRATIYAGITYTVNRLRQVWPNIRIFVLLPQYDGGGEAGVNSYDYIDDTLEKAAKILGCAVIDGRQTGASYTTRDLYYDSWDRLHPNKYGMRKMAEYITACLASHYIIGTYYD